MIAYTLRRAAQAIVVVLFVTLIVFFLFRMIPGDAALVRLGMEPTPEALAKLRAEMGLDKPLYLQYFIWLTKALRGDLGISLIDKKSVSHLIAQKLPVTLELSAIATLCSLLIAIPLSCNAAVFRNTFIDYSIRLFAFAGISIPVFWLAVMLMYVFALEFRWLPAGGYVPLSMALIDHLKHLVMPLLAVTVNLVATQVRFLRSSLLDELGKDYIRMARGKGLSERVILYKHAVRNSLLPLITIVGINFGSLLSGLVVTETIFAWPGTGWLLIQSVRARDYNVVMGCVTVAAFLFIFINLIVDLSYAYLDPRITYT